MAIGREVSLAARKYALKNAVEYGKAHEGSVLNKVISLYPEQKSDIRSLAKEVSKIVAEVNSLGKEALESEYKGFESEFAEEQKVKLEKTANPSMDLEGAVQGNFATRYPPAPNGYMHIGHAKALFLESESAKRYNGKLFLYFDDTNPEKDKQEFVDKFHEVLDWLGVKFDKEYYASDNMAKIYESARTLISNGDAYACSCSADQIKEGRFNRKTCAHREKPAAESLSQFEDMLSGKYNENEMIIRFRGDMASENTALRDPTLLRIKADSHYRQGTKYCVWPTYDLNTPVMDSLNGVTDVLRSKEFELRDDLARMILEKLSLRVPRIHSFSRLVIKGNITHKRELNALINEGEISGFDDPRLVTIVALRRRGILPEAIRNFVLKLGMTKTDGVVSIDALLAENKKLIDPIAKHLFFVPDPIKVIVEDADPIEIKLKLHPSSDMGFREYKIGREFFISAEDTTNLKEGDTVRLKDLMDIKIVSVGANTIKAHKVIEGSKGKIIQWVSEGNFIECSVSMPETPLDESGKFDHGSMKVAKGYVESHAKELKEHEIVQFERFGYCILDKKASNGFILTLK